jgi:predicted flap endonuclease-1-like 5' DNA nuclease
LLPGQGDEDEPNQNRRPQRNQTIYDEDGFPMPSPHSPQPTLGSVGTSPRIDSTGADSVTIPITGTGRSTRHNGRTRPRPDAQDMPFGDEIDDEIMEQLGDLIRGSQIPHSTPGTPPAAPASPTSGASLSSQEIAQMDASDDDDFARLGDLISGATSAQRPVTTPEPPPRSYSDEDVPPDNDDTSPLTAISGIGANRAQRLQAMDVHSFDDLAQADARELAANIPGISPRMAQSWIDDAQERANYGGLYDDKTVSSPQSYSAPPSPVPGATSPSAAQIASAVDYADNDDDARLAADMRATVSSTQPATRSAPVSNTDGNDAQLAATGATLRSEPSKQITEPAKDAPTTPVPQSPDTLPSPPAQIDAPIKSAITPEAQSTPATRPIPQPETSPSASQIAASVDAANNDDNARLVTGVRAAAETTNTSQPAAPVDMSALSSLGNSIAQAVRTAIAHGANPSASAYAGHIAQQSGIRAANVPEVGQFARMANQMQLTPQQTSGVIRDVAQTGSIGPELANSIRSSLSGLASSSGQSINMDAAISGLQQAATAMTTAVQSSAGGQAQFSGNAPAKSGGQTASGGDPTFGKPPVSGG